MKHPSEDLAARIRHLTERVGVLIETRNLPQKKQTLLELQEASSHQDFWKDPKKAEVVLRRAKELEDEIQYWEGIPSECQLQLELLHEAEASHDNAAKKDIESWLIEAEKTFRKRELAVLFTSPHDEGDALVSIHAGTGGVDAQDFAAMLQRMYIRFFERQGFEVTLLSDHAGEEAGIKSVVMEIRGRYAYGYLKAENGVHRLVRQSPFNANALRQTSFVLVEVLPLLDEVDIVIDPKDLRIDTYRASGAGGQHVNKTESAVRIIHLPTNIMVEVQSERSQGQNKERAMKILASRLQQYQDAKNQEEKQRLRGEHSQTEWGNQIRSYVLHPYKMVKDHRTKLETSDAEGVLNGEIFPFIEAYLQFSAKTSSGML